VIEFVAVKKESLVFIQTSGKDDSDIEGAITQKFDSLVNVPPSPKKINELKYFVFFDTAPDEAAIPVVEEIEDIKETDGRVAGKIKVLSLPDFLISEEY
jgi:hypothetical protein